MNQLTEIKSIDWPELRDKFLPNWPENHVGYYLVDNYIKWIKKDPNINNLSIYSLNDDWSDGTFVVVDRYQLFVYTKSDNNNRLTDLLRLLDWSNGFQISYFRKKFRSAIVTVIVELHLEREYDSETLLYYLPREKALQLDVTTPDGYTLKSMSTWEHAEKANSVWTNRGEGTLFFLKRLIDWNLNIGLFNNKDELISWCFRLQSGALGALQTDEMYLRKGFGSLVVQKMAKLLADMDQDSFAFVWTQNEPSKRLFKKIGFTVIDHCYSLGTASTAPFQQQWKD